VQIWGCKSSIINLITMLKTYHLISYLGGLTSKADTGKVNLDVDSDLRLLRVYELSGKKASEELYFENIVEVSYEDKQTRSAGKAAAGAIAGAVLTGGLGIIAGAALGGRKKNDGCVYITHNKYGKETDLIFKPKAPADLYAYLNAQVLTMQPENFDRDAVRATKPKPQQGCLVFAILLGGGLLAAMIKCIM
jgi:hypothetical protein